MVFSSPIFLFGFLPATLLLYFLSPRFIKNTTLLLCSLFFYAWGEVFYLAVMVVSIFSNYIFGLLIFKFQQSIQLERFSKFNVTVGILVNILLLFSFKYANFVVDNINVIFTLINIKTIELGAIHLPLGISFFTFQAITYLVDIYRKEVAPQKNIFNLALYISLFPQLIAGPIVRYNSISSQITNRKHSIEQFVYGVKRFVYGLAKKVLIANTLGEVSDTIFSLSESELTMPLAWIGILTYTLQIFFDFSGYSDMAIGLGRMFGFKFLENFNYPYISTSIREFWRRWHISLSTWFKDYVYIPLGGNRVSAVRVYVNLLVVFVLTGLWHGASWNFLIWGLFHGLFLAAEHAGFSRLLNRMWKPVQHIYMLLVIIFGWVFFRHDTLPQAINYIGTMLDISNLHTTNYQFAQILSYETVYALIMGIVLSMPVYPWIKKYLEQLAGNSTVKNIIIINTPRLAIFSSLLFLSILKVSSSTYNPFIYFRF